jgi:hypothetical protein
MSSSSLRRGGHPRARAWRTSSARPHDVALPADVFHFDVGGPPSGTSPASTWSPAPDVDDVEDEEDLDVVLVDLETHNGRDRSPARRSSAQMSAASPTCLAALK